MLRVVFRIDAVAACVSGIALLIAGPLLADTLGIPLGVIWPLGILLIGFAAVVWAVQARPRLDRPAVWAVIATNGAWVATSLLAVALGWLPLTGLGTELVIAQAVLGALLTDLEFVGLRRTV